MPETGSIFKTPPEIIKNGSDCKNYCDKSQKSAKPGN
jgi:hypothetical protein